MNDKDLNGEKKTIKRVSLNNLDKVTKYMAKKVREYENDPERAGKLQEYRTFGYLMGKLIDCFKAQYEQDIERRLERIEIMLEKQA